MKKILVFILVLSVLLTACGSADVEETSEYVKENGKITVAYPAPGSTSINLPESIPAEYLETLVNRLNSTQYTCAMYYIDLETGFTISYNENREFAAASLIKAPYLFYILDMIKNGELSLDDELVYKKSKHYFAGTGNIKNMPDGSKLKLSKIIEEMAIESDNTGFKMLYTEIMSVYQFHEKAYKDFGAKYYSGLYGNICQARGVAKMFEDVYFKYKSGDELYTWFMDLMVRANFNDFIKGGLPVVDGECIYEVAHKYGEDAKAYNDAAIVFYEDRPYLLVILTDYLNIRTKTFMHKVSADVLKIHEYICNN
ncbi:class A beta-lactamase-related serine hydrolase [Eubacteriales bacterium OttesenSCG-928-G02]|nr:class A beta-lactamase-related serine hydrolase [Eubacteriales bacterium OttesenSCG-928-G02]